ncbi:MAG: LPS assembly protein LptD [Gammaproteobacteria bacterium]|nr:LPS assembly protein LptD [Gammaproteobacteria bacterium]
MTLSARGPLRVLAFAAASLLCAAVASGAEPSPGADDLCGPVVQPFAAAADAPVTSPADATTGPQADPGAENITISSDGAIFDRNGDARLQGKVDIHQGQRRISAEDVTYEASTSSFEVAGEVEYRDPQIRVRGESGSYDAAGGARIGVAQFEVPSRPARGTAEELAITPDGHVTLRKVEYTTCPVGNEDWILTASDISLDTTTRNGTGKGVRLDFKGVPILYTPIISFPLGDQRKSGFLFPDFNYSQRSGIELAVPYYFNFAPNYDLLATPRYYSDRGLELQSEFRYLGAELEGSIAGNYLPGDALRDRDRSYLRWEHVGDFARRWRIEVDAANASDGNYFEDFGLGSEGTSVTYLERNAQLRYFGNHWSILGQVQNFQTIDQSIADATRPYSRVPRLLARGVWRDGPLGFEYAIDGEAVNFHRDDGLTARAWT